ncbi:MAG TPA: dephospho-CoA kinase [Leucothrix mucor]|nr:dephospho-CoA kinase [Leucothrix mucor]
MLKIGLTGGIGCGKSTVTDELHNKGIVIIDADKIARELVELDPDILEKIRLQFGDDIITADGLLNRVALKKLIFSNEKKLQQLESILHPRIRSAIELAIHSELDKPHSSVPYLIVDIPLLIEKDYMELFDEIVVVDCTPEQQVRRVQQRDDINSAIIKSIMSKQINRKERLNHATFILDNSDSQEKLKQQINSLHERFIVLSQL